MTNLLTLILCVLFGTILANNCSVALSASTLPKREKPVPTPTKAHSEETFNVRVINP